LQYYYYSIVSVVGLMTLITFSEARHLVSRTGLGAEWDFIKHLEGRPLAEAVDHVLNQSAAVVVSPPALTPWFELEPMRLMDAKNRKLAWTIAQQEGKRLQGWWIEQMLATRAPVVERMTLFWHNHFTSSIQKTLQPSLLYQQNQLFRRHAMGNFADLLQEIARNPAMLVYLDGYQNTKDQPNENFARELLELFTLGHGHYTEADIKAAAKVFTGWGVDNSNGKFMIHPNQHDASTVTFLGKTGVFRGEDIIRILLEHPRTAERVAEKAWLAFVSSNNPDPAMIRRWAQVFRQSGYAVKNLMREILTSEAFWSPRNRGTLVKSPIELLIGTERMLPYPRESTSEMLDWCRLLGQELFDPPNVKGWSGGDNWINTQTLLVRRSYLSRLSRGNMDERVDTGLKLPNVPAAQLIEWMLPVTPLQALPTTPGARRLVRALLLDPAFQVS
jgi:uncharacterized protein (DUF1800 family)